MRAHSSVPSVWGKLLCKVHSYAHTPSLCLYFRNRLLIMLPTHAATCTMGPSLPKLRPDATDRTCSCVGPRMRLHVHVQPMSAKQRGPGVGVREHAYVLWKQVDTICRKMRGRYRVKRQTSAQHYRHRRLRPWARQKGTIIAKTFARFIRKPDREIKKMRKRKKAECCRPSIPGLYS